jgi:hypothetical protein
MPDSEDLVHSANWRKSRYSMGNGNFVEAASTANSVLIRDTKDLRGPVLGYSTDAWRDFLARTKAERVLPVDHAGGPLL